MPAQKNSSGLVHTLPVLLVSLLIIGTFMIFGRDGGKGIPSGEKGILSESSGEGDSSDSGSSDRSGSSGSSDNDDEEEAEIRVETVTGGVRVRTRTEEGRQRVDIFEGGQRLRIETRDGRTVVKLENEEEEEEVGELEDEEEVEFEVRTATGEAEIKLRVEGNKFVFRERGTRIEAESNFPLSIDLATNELIVTTPAGVKRVAVLPQQAVDNMIRVGHINVILPPTPSPSPTAEASPGASPTASPGATLAPVVSPIQAVEITQEDGEIVYVITGAARERFLGLLDVLIPRTLEVSAQTGELVGLRQSLIDRILDLLSFGSPSP